jgi:hypothetical protein
MNAASSGGSHYVNFSGTRSANTMVGTLTIHVVTSDGMTNFHFDRTVNNYTLTKVP